MTIDLSQWNLYVADDVPPGPIPEGVALETMQIATCNSFKAIQREDRFPTGLQADHTSMKVSLYWRLRTTQSEIDKFLSMKSYDALELTVRCTNAVSDYFKKENKFGSVTEFLKLDEKQMSRQRGIGRKTIKEILRVQRETEQMLKNWGNV